MSDWDAPEESSTLPEPGEVIGDKYRLVRQVGSGGMGAVYEAVHVEIGSRSAVKFLNPRYAQHAEAIERFQREARAAAAIGHDAIVGVHDIGRTPAGLHYLVMELLEGESLGDAIDARRRLDVPLTAYVACQVLSGLTVAHEAHIVHRDLKPDNIFLVETGSLVPGVKILDFGISKILGSGRISGSASALTRTGTVLGTPEYMSPEQARGEDDIDQRADLFALGVILFECVTGAVPFTGSNYNAVMAHIIEDDPPRPSQLRPDLDPTFEDIILRALCKNRHERFQYAEEMFQLLLPYVDERAVGRISWPRELAPTKVKILLPETVEVVDVSTTAQAPHHTDLSWESGERTVAAQKKRSRHAALAVAAALMVVAGTALGLYVGLSSDTRSDGPGYDTAALIAGDPGLLPAEPSPAEISAPVANEVPATLDAATTTASAETTRVVVELGGLPTGARVFVDGLEVDDLPLRLVRDVHPRRLRVEVDGHEPFEVDIIPSEDRTLDVVLTPVREASPRKSTGRIRRPPRERPVDVQPPTKRDYEPTYWD